MTTAPTLGIQDGISDTEYFALPYPSASLLRELWDRTPRHAKHRLEEPADAEALLMGSVTHCLVFEPDKFAERYVALGDVDLRTKAGKAEMEAALASANGRRVVRGQVIEPARQMAASVWGEPVCAGHLERVTKAEMAVLFDIDGQVCKAKLDGVILEDGWAAVVDLKTTRNASMQGFASSVASYSYHMQAALYLKAAKSLGWDIDNFVFLAVEKEAPHVATAYVLDPLAVAIGEEEIRAALKIYRRCMEEGAWPGYDDCVPTLSLPGWRNSQARAKLDAAAKGESPLLGDDEIEGEGDDEYGGF